MTYHPDSCGTVDALTHIKVVVQQLNVEYDLCCRS